MSTIIQDTIEIDLQTFESMKNDFVSLQHRFEMIDHQFAQESYLTSHGSLHTSTTSEEFLYDL